MEDDYGYDSGIYYNPEKHGLTTIGSIDWSDGCYQFNLTGVWQDRSNGRLLWGNDSGCSCPSPFEDTKVADLSTGSWMELKTYLDERNPEADPNDWGDEPRDTEIADLMALVIKAVDMWSL